MAGNLQNPLAKLSRGSRQLQALQKEVWDRWPPRKAWPVDAKEHRGGLEYRFYVRELPTINLDWVLWAGEIMFDFRSALDHLIYELHERHFRGKWPPRIEETMMFPIFDTPEKFTERGYRRVKNLSKRDRRTIMNLQPYVARKDRMAWVRGTLHDLNALHNIDKHRKLHAVRASHGGAVIPQFPPETGFRQTPHWGPVKHHGHVETWTFTQPPAKMQQHSGAFIAPALEYGDDFVPLVPLLREMATAVMQTITLFRRRYPAMR